MGYLINLIFVYEIIKATDKKKMRKVVFQEQNNWSL